MADEDSRIMATYGSACAQVAQSVEHVLGKDEVSGSIPLLGFCPDCFVREI